MKKVRFYQCQTTIELRGWTKSRSMRDIRDHAVSQRRFHALSPRIFCLWDPTEKYTYVTRNVL